jgi:hypothetical protein
MKESFQYFNVLIETLELNCLFPITSVTHTVAVIGPYSVQQRQKMMNQQIIVEFEVAYER